MKKLSQQIVSSSLFKGFIIGVIVNSMDDARVDAEIESIKRAEAALETSDDALSLENQISALSNRLRDLNNSVARLSKSVGKDSI